MILSENEYKNGLAGLQKIMVLTLDQHDDPEIVAVIDILTDALINYEQRHYHISPPTPESAAQFRKEQEGVVT